MPETPLKVLFMHGLESGPGGRKDRYLRQHFDVCTPDMQTSIYSLRQSNSVVRQLLRRPMLITWVVSAAAMWPWLGLHGLLPLCVGIALWLIVLFVMRKLLIRQALRASLERCIEIQAAAIKTFQPDAVVGSSWGGGIALMCAARGMFSGPYLLLAPSLQRMVERLDDGQGSWLDTMCRSIPAEIARRTLIVHGDEDESVPLDHSRRVAAAAGIELEVIPGGDHGLNAALVDSEQGPSKNDRLRTLIAQMAASDT